MNRQLMGIDFGTGGCKLTVIDTQGNVCATAFKEYPSEHNKLGWSEQNPELWIDALIYTVNSCKEQLGNDLSNVASIGITASTHNAVLLDKNKKVIRNCIMWNDQRSGEQCERLKRDYGDEIFNIGMQQPTPTWTLPQLMWISENEPENYKKIDKILFTKDYVRSYITGDYYTDIVDAQGSLLFDAYNREWSQKLCDMISLPIEVLPEVRKSKEIAGYVQAETAKITGLPEGVPVIVGCSDTAAEDLGAGAVREGQVIVKLATAGNVNIISKKAHPHVKTYTYPYSVEDMWYTVTATNSSAASYRWLRDSLYKVEKGICEEDCEDIYENMNREAAQIAPGSEGLIFHPYLLGERCPYFNPKARSNFFGITMIHDKRHFSRAVLEGVAYSLYDCLTVLSDFSKDLKDIRIIGGGAKSELWSQIVCDVFGLEVRYPQNAESSFGGALLAGVGIGVFADAVEAADKCVKIAKVYQPNIKNHQKYMSYFAVYKKITEALTPIWDELSYIVNE